MVVGLTMIIVTFWGTANYVFPFYSHTYPFAWYGLIFFLDGLLWWRWDKGIIFCAPLRFITLLFWSAVFWFFFELWNLRLQNWYYAGVPPDGPWAHLEAYLDFATVLPGMLLVFELLHCLNFPRQLKTPFRLSRKLRKVWTYIGLFMLISPLIFPDIFFPFVWGALIFLLEPICAKFEGPSLLRDAENGEWTTMARLLVAGMLCGGYWELWNYWSLEKWVYTVPLFSRGKLFEMPYLGFLGFAPFCVQCFVMINAVTRVKRRHGTDSFHKNTGSNASFKFAYPVMVILGLVLCELSYYHIKKHTIDSRAEPLQQILEDVSRDDAQRLQAQGWHYPKQILNNWENAAQAIAEPMREAVFQRLELSAILHMGSSNARLLERAGVDSRKILAAQEPDFLFETLTDLNRTLRLRKSPILKRRIVAWIEAAKRHTAVY
jgi:hypothetical protein